jgi:DNA-directed RNA polymerase specialized sigma24 family protein
MANYTDRDEIAELVVEWRKTGEMPQRMVEVVTLIATGVMKRYARNQNLDDCVQDCLVIIILKEHLFDIKKNLFAYITTLCLNTIRCDYKKSAKWNRHELWGDMEHPFEQDQ